jgi:hypothetical protein
VIRRQTAVFLSHAPSAATLRLLHRAPMPRILGPEAVPDLEDDECGQIDQVRAASGMHHQKKARQRLHVRLRRLTRTLRLLLAFRAWRGHELRRPVRFASIPACCAKRRRLAERMATKIGAVRRSTRFKRKSRKIR